MIPISVTRIREFETCKKQFKLNHIDKIEYPTPVYFTFGNRLHEIMAEKIRQSMEDNTTIVEFNGNVADDSPFNDEQNVLKKVSMVLPDYISKWGVEDKLAYREDWSKCAWDDKDVAYRGIIDFWCLTEQNMLTIKDFKSGHRIEGKFEVDNDFQLKSYAYMKSLDFPDVEYINAEKHFLRFNAIVDTQFYVKDLQAVRKHLERMLKKINAETKFPAQVGSHCASCLVSDHCEEFQKATATNKELKSHNEMLKYVFLTSAKIDRYKKELKKIVDKTGEIMIDDVRAYYKESATKSVDSAKFLELTRNMEIPVEKILEEMSISVTDAKAIIKKAGYKSDLFKIEGLIGETKSTRFTVEKNRED